MNKFTVHTDLACESEVMHDKSKAGTEYTEQTVNGYKVSKLWVKNEIGEARTGKKSSSAVQ